MARPKKNIGDIAKDVAKSAVKAVKDNPLVAQNVKYAKAVAAGPTVVAKTAAMDLAAGAAGAAAGKLAGAVVAKAGRKVAGQVGEYVADKSVDVLTAPLQKASPGGRLFNVQTPFGNTVGSTRIMNSKQASAAIGNLAKAAENRANEIGSAVASDLAAAARSAASGFRAAGAPLTVTAVNKKRGAVKKR